MQQGSEVPSIAKRSSLASAQVNTHSVAYPSQLVLMPAVKSNANLSRPNISTGEINCFYRYIILY
jgi:hypothetical protein